MSVRRWSYPRANLCYCVVKSVTLHVRTNGALKGSARHRCYVGGVYIGGESTLSAAKRRCLKSASGENVMSKYTERNRPICTWVTPGELALFKAIAATNNVSVATYLRAMIVDVLSEEGSKVIAKKAVKSRDLFAESIGQGA